MLHQAFDKYALEYDQHFTYSFIGRAQRNRVFKFLSPILKNVHTILEVNCGTGEDAITFTEKGKKVLATDISSTMIEVAKNKNSGIDFKVCNAIDIDKFKGTYDLIFSNFGGLNCLNKQELNLFFKAASVKLNKGGRMVLVFISTNCFLEKFYFKLKGKSFRRKMDENIASVVVEETFPVYYYSPKIIIDQAKNDFKMIQLKPIGLFIPPSYMESKISKSKWLFRILVKLESLFANFSSFANNADHFYIAFEKNK